MQNHSEANPISIEQFAAFLDGNLPEAEMQAVASAIDGNPDFTAILGEVLNVDEAIAPLDGTTDFFDGETLPDEENFVLPEIPAVEAETVEVLPAEAEAPILKSAEPGDDTPSLATAAAPEETPEEWMPQSEALSEEMNIPPASEAADLTDFGGEF